jgi:ribosomal protein S12 methylthiotransferase accessory factor
MHIGAKACRILVPDYSEIYPVDDLIWDNTNKALHSAPTSSTCTA